MLKRDELLALRKRGVTLGKQSPTVAEWWSIWLDKFAKQLKPNIREDYRGIGRRYVDNDALGRRKVSALTTAEVQDWVDRLCDQVAPSTVRNAHARLHKAMKVAIQRHIRTDNPADDIDLPEARPEPAIGQLRSPPTNMVISTRPRRTPMQSIGSSNGLSRWHK